MDLDMALCAFSESVRGVKLRAEDCMSLIGGGVIRQEGLRNSVMLVVGWWTVVYPNDWPAVLKYVPVELAWFLLKHVAVHGTVGQQPAFSPFRSGIATLARESWAQLGRYFHDHGIMEETRFGPGVLTGCNRSFSVGERSSGIIVGNVPDSPRCGCGCSILG